MDLNVIELPLVVELVLTGVAYLFLRYTVRMSDTQLEDCGWVGHQSQG